ncbi:hypothetical protein HOR43_gp30 [Streptomyces phage Ididsumtinwong]|uniref:Helix-turn-helix DNA binding domain protein n=1 Tax=Streptomyces phage Ididsumtinwong TaxID=1920308 RepID=A0A1J0MBZ1_9CAUD|nr:hypothetical protein HOR43_gp30 [Streptomyces phage Ididsumtinwong]APD18527.1 hypothetical protein SEA_IDIDSUMTINWONG_52 [Streptomyces phage Ididsumtinwong]
MKFNVTIEIGPTPEFDTMDEPTVVRLIRQAHAQGFTISADANAYTITLANGQRNVRIMPARRPQLPTDRQRDELHRMVVLGRELTWARSSRNVGVLTDGALKMSHQLSDGLLERGYVTGTGHAGSEARRTLVGCLAYARSAKNEPRDARNEILRRALLDLAQTDTVAWRETADPADTAPEPEPEPEQPAAEDVDEPTEAPVDEPTPQPATSPAETRSETSQTHYTLSTEYPGPSEQDGPITEASAGRLLRRLLPHDTVMIETDHAILIDDMSRRTLHFRDLPHVKPRQMKIIEALLADDAPAQWGGSGGAPTFLLGRALIGSQAVHTMQENGLLQPYVKGGPVRPTLAALLAYARTLPRKDQGPAIIAGARHLTEPQFAETVDEPADEPATAAGALPGPSQYIADELNRRGVPTNTAAGALFTDMMALFDKYERERAAARALQGDTNPYDLDEWEPFEAIANEWASTEGDEQAREQFLDRLADQLTLDNIRVLRQAGEAAAAVTPRVVRAERARYKVPEIARRAALTDGRVYQILRGN